MSEKLMFSADAWEIAREVAAIDKQLLSSSAVEAFAKLAEMAHNLALAEYTTLHPAAEWTEVDGPVLWWRIAGSREYPPYVAAFRPSPERSRWSRIPRVEVKP